MVGVAAGVGAVGSIAGAAISKSGSKSAASSASSADLYAAQLAQQRYEETRGDLAPYNQLGQAALGTIPNIIDNTNTDLNNAYMQMQGAYDQVKGHIPGTMTQDQLENTPGYQWNLQQGLKAVQQSAAAKGLGISSPALQAAANYATGLANSNYQQAFANQQTQFGDYNNLFGNSGTLFNTRNSIDSTLYNQNYNLASLGENAGAQTGNVGAALANTQANALQNAGSAQAAGAVGGANALQSGINGVANAADRYFNPYTNTGTDTSGYSSGGGAFDGGGTTLSDFSGYNAEDPFASPGFGGF